ncbi:hypothetical protein [Phenylobacterium sp.]|uniref:hypothetical protein n=1 Tax=Phenylobacterium sp. TaxID=1871053 RepID=UPI0025E2D6E8|nr:hypothetical protein [Phenylobacterium sp.]
MPDSDVFELSNGEIVVWADVGSVMLKVRPGDPIELGEGELDELDELIEALKRLRTHIA